MADNFSFFDNLPSFFDQSKKTPGSLSYEELQQRRRLAYALASRARPYPKTVGEGLSALGEGLADRWATQDLNKAESEHRARATKAQQDLLVDDLTATPGIAPVTAPPVTPPVTPPITPPVTPPVAPPPGVAPGGAPAPAIAPAPTLAPKRAPAPPPGPAIGALGGDPRAEIAMKMMNAQPEGPVGVPNVPPGQPVIQTASLQPPTEPGPRPPVAPVPTSVPSTVPTGAAPEETPQTGAMALPEWKARIAQNETGAIAARGGDPYKAVGERSRRGDYPYGKYQVMGENVPKWTLAHLGKAMSPQEFLNDPKAQEAVADGQGAQYIDKHGPEGAAKAWFAGEKGMNDPRRKDTLGTHVAEYARRFNLPLKEREAIVSSLASTGSSSPSLASEEDARLADVTGQATAAPRVRLASLRNAPTPDGAPPSVIDAGIDQSISARNAQQTPAPAPAQAAPQTQIAQAPPLQAPIAKAPAQEATPAPAGPQPSLQSVLQKPENAFLLRQMKAARGVMSDPLLTGTPEAAQAAQVYKDARDQAHDLYKIEATRWHEQTKLIEAHRLGARERQQKEETHASTIATSAQALEDTKIKAHGIDKSTEGVAEVPTHVERAQRIKSLVSSGAVTGLLGPVELTALKAKAAAGFPPDPRIAMTEQLRADLTSLAGAARVAVIGPGQVGVFEQQLLQRAAAGDITYDAKTIKEVTAVAEKVLLGKAISHQQKLDQYGKENPEAAQKMYDRYSLPMENVVPSDHPAVRRLMDNLDHPKAIEDFDKKFHTPGLAMKLIERERRR